MKDRTLENVDKWISEKGLGDLTDQYNCAGQAGRYAGIRQTLEMRYLQSKKDFPFTPSQHEKFRRLYREVRKTEEMLTLLAGMPYESKPFYIDRER